MSLNRWRQFYGEDPSLGDVHPSAAAQQAAVAFAESGAQVILDAGCGAGRDTFLLAGSGAQVVGLDEARSGLALARARAASLPVQPFWVQGDARSLPFTDVSFGGAYSFGLLHEFVGQSADRDVAATMAEMLRVLRPGGTAVVAVLAGEPEEGLPHVRLFSEAMFDAAVASFDCIEKKAYDDLGCTGRVGYRVWFGRLVKR
jgi:ubiquinone/menaquinone biosynthesis C-methylase UbiE